MQQVGQLQKEEMARLRTTAVRAAMASNGEARPAAAAAPAPKEIIKEGLSEYFIYTIEGTETIANGWSKRMRSLEGMTVPFKIQYRYRPQEYGDQLVRMYLLTNDKASKLGTTPLPDGMVRVFRENGRDGLSFLAAQSVKYIPIGDKIELNLGADPNVIFELIKLRAYRNNIWMQLGGLDVFRRVDDGAGQIEVNSSVSAGMTTRSIPNASGTTRPRLSTWRSVGRSPDMSCSAASSARPSMTIRQCNSRPTSMLASGGPAL